MISSMNKNTFTTILLLCVSFVSAQDVHYYKLTRKVENDVSSTQVSGGQFITFISDICFESNNKGVGVGHGKLTLNKNYSTSECKTYQGSSYWGSNTTFKFNSDKSVLNVIPYDGNVYVYKRTTPPDGVVTCSLIKKKKQNSEGSSGGIEPIYVPTPIYSGGTTTTPTPIQPAKTGSTPSKKWRLVTREVDCPHCHHSGKCSTCNGKGGYINPMTGNYITCPNCRNGWCTHCNGRGTITKTERVYE